MPTIMSHAVVPLAIAMAAGRCRIARPVAAVGMLLSVLPDADVISFKLGIAYADQFGHRGASHSFVAAMLFTLAAMAVLPAARTWVCGAFLFVSGASHGLLDTLTNGGLGAALLWPISDARFHGAITPIKVSPIGAAFFSDRGVAVLISEAYWIWLPCFVIASLAVVVRYGIAHRSS
jgi:inner membrane protein